MTNSVVPDPIRMLPWGVLVPVILIGGFGTIVLYSAAGGSFSPWAASHAVRFCIFLAMAIIISRMPMELWLRYAYHGYLVVLAMLIVVELLGAVAGGSQRWIDLGIIRLQPSELMKLMVVLAAARFYHQLPTGEIRGWNALWPAGLIIGFPAALVILQPDLGTALMITAGGVSVMFLAGLPLRLFIGAGVALAAAVPLVFTYALHGYQQKRVLIFLDPESDPLGSGYHITQSKIAIGSGGFFGKGYLNGTQSHLDYLPEGHTDFVFATMAEEWGFVGGLFVIALFLLLGRWGLAVSSRAQSRFARLTAAALTMTIFFYFTINLLMVMGLAPVVGIPLPLISHGGTAMLTVMLCLGILMSIDRTERKSVGLR